MRVLVLGASGMLGNAMFRLLAESPNFHVQGSIRSSEVLRYFAEHLRGRIVCGMDVNNVDSVTELLSSSKPEVVINCVGLVKQIQAADNPLAVIPINSIFPHRLAKLCGIAQARLIHISTDCVFTGTRGNYREDDPADAQDLYGRTKHLGEVHYPHTVTLRTSIIGHELGTAHGLISWFLSQTQPVRGYTRAIFSGLPTVELARVIRDFVFTNPALHGTFHVASSPIAKYELLRLVAKEYGKTIEIAPDGHVTIDRSLNAERFLQRTGYIAPPWPQLIANMRAFG